MRHVIAWSVLLTAILPRFLAAQPATPPTRDRDWVLGKTKDLDPNPDQTARYQAAKADIVRWIAAAKDEASRMELCRIVLDVSTDEKLLPGRRDALLKVVADWAAAGEVAPAERDKLREQRFPKLLEEMSSAAVGPARRAAARDALIMLVADGSNELRTDRSVTLARVIEPFLTPKKEAAPPVEGEDVAPAPWINAWMIVARSQQSPMVPLLMKGIKAPQAAIRYWAVKGLADAQWALYRPAMDGKRDVLASQIKEIAALFKDGESPAILAEVYRALGASQAVDMTDQRCNSIIFDEFANIFRKRLARLGAGQLDGLALEIGALNSVAQWERVYRKDKAQRAELLSWPAQILSWSTTLLTRNANQKVNLARQQKLDVQAAMIKSAQVISNAISKDDLDLMNKLPGKPRPVVKAMDLADTVMEQLAAENMTNLQLAVVEWVSEEGQKDDYWLKALQVERPKKLSPN